MHIGKVSFGSVKVGQTLGVKVDFARRALVAKNHSATHILNYALRQVLGEKVDQRGSFVGPERLRFDFTHNKPLELEELRRVEEICNQQIAKAHSVHCRDTALKEAEAING